MDKSIGGNITKLCALTHPEEFVDEGLFRSDLNRKQLKQDCDCWRMSSKLMLPEFLFSKTKHHQTPQSSRIHFPDNRRTCI